MRDMGYWVQASIQGACSADNMLDETACTAPALGCGMRGLCMDGCPLMLQVVLCESDERETVWSRTGHEAVLLDRSASVRNGCNAVGGN